MSAQPNLYADDPDTPVFPVAGVVRIEGNTVYCRQDADLRGYCLCTGQRCYEHFAQNRIQHLALSASYWRIRSVAIAVDYLLPIVIAMTLGLEVACVCWWAIRMLVDLPVIFSKRFRAKTNFVSYGLWDRRMSFAGVVAMLPFFVVFGIGISRLFRGRLTNDSFLVDDPKIDCLCIDRVVCMGWRFVCGANPRFQSQR